MEKKMDGVIQAPRAYNWAINLNSSNLTKRPLGRHNI